MLAPVACVSVIGFSPHPATAADTCLQSGSLCLAPTLTPGASATNATSSGLQAATGTSVGAVTPTTGSVTVPAGTSGTVGQTSGITTAAGQVSGSVNGAGSTGVVTGIGTAAGLRLRGTGVLVPVDTAGLPLGTATTGLGATIPKARAVLGVSVPGLGVRRVGAVARLGLNGLPTSTGLRLRGFGGGGGTELVAIRNPVAIGRSSSDGGQPNVVSVGAAGSGRRIINVQGGSVAESSRDAVTVGQLRGATRDVVSYDTSSGTRGNSVTLAGGQPGTVVLQNLGPGVQGTDAANVDQLSASSGSTLRQAQSYTDARLGTLAALTQRQIEDVQHDAWAGTAAALAATGLRYDDRPGKTAVAGAVSYYHDQAGVAVGLGHTSLDGHLRLNAAVTVAPTDDKPDVGAVVGGSWSFN